MSLKKFSSFLVATVFILLISISASAQINLVRQWTGTTNIIGIGQATLNFTLAQDGSVISGLKAGDSDQGIILGTLTGNSLTFRIGFVELAYAYDVTATTDGNTITGTLVDSSSQTGTFTASKLVDPTPVLNTATKINQPPVAVVKGDDVKLTLLKFKNPVFTRQLSLRSTTPKGSFQYEVEIQGAEKRKIVTKKNTLTLKNLKPGSYTVRYVVVGLKNGKKSFTTKQSPKASFKIKK